MKLNETQWISTNLNELSENKKMLKVVPNPKCAKNTKNFKEPAFAENDNILNIFLSRQIFFNKTT